MKVHVAVMLFCLIAFLVHFQPNDAATASGSINVNLNEGNSGTIEIRRIDPCGNFTPEEVDIKKHWDMPSGIILVKATLEWSNTSFRLDFGIGMGECPDNGVQLANKNDTSGYIEISYSNGSEMALGQWFAHIKVLNCGELRGKSCNYTISVTLVTSPPSQVTIYNPSGNDISFYSIRLSWSKATSPNFDKYELHMSETNPNFVPSKNTLLWTSPYCNPAYNSYNVTGLDDDTLYHFRVRVYDKYGGYSDSSIVSVRTRVYIDYSPAKVTVSDAGDVTDTSVTIRWTRCLEDDFKEYQLHMSQNYKFEPNASTLLQTFSNPYQDSYKVIGLAPLTTYTFVVMVFDKAGFNSTSNYHNVTTLSVNTPPIAVISEISPKEVVKGSYVNFVGYGTDTDEGWLITEYLWLSSIDGVIGRVQVFSTNLLSVGKHTITFKVKDDRGAWSEDAVAYLVVTEPEKPNAKPIAILSKESMQAFVNEEITIDATSSNDPDGNITAYRFDLGDGNIIDWTQNGIVVHSYSEAGEYIVRVQVRDNNGTISDWASMTIKIIVKKKNVPADAFLFAFLAIISITLLITHPSRYRIK